MSFAYHFEGLKGPLTQALDDAVAEGKNLVVASVHHYHPRKVCSRSNVGQTNQREENSPVFGSQGMDDLCSDVEAGGDECCSRDPEQVRRRDDNGSPSFIASWLTSCQ
jgi:hypothetical protein